MKQQIEHLCAHTGVSPEQARDAWKPAGGDLLDALVWLEQRGVIADAGVCTYSTKDGVTAEPPNQTSTGIRAGSGKAKLAGHCVELAGGQSAGSLSEGFR
ncbi:MAG: hypothetical protein V8S71_01335 [Oscillospiraceae bacterium]